MEQNEKSGKLLEVKDLRVSFFTPAGEVKAVSGISYDLDYDEVMGIVGESGSGKSQEAYSIMGLLQSPGKVIGGSITFEGRDVLAFSKKEMASFRGSEVAMIFQNFGLLAQKTVLDNVCFPFLAASGKVTAENRARALELLDRVGLAEKAQSYPSQLSGGQKQRVAIARALACEPEVILCDEATSALDPKSTNTILKLLRDINRETGVTLVVITHSMDVVEKICNNVAVLEHGRVVEQGSVAKVFADPQAEATRVLLGKVDWDA